MPNVGQNSNGTAYKPPIAAPKTNGIAKPAKPNVSKPVNKNYVLTAQQQQMLHRMLETKQIKPEHLAQLLQMGQQSMQSVLGQLTIHYEKQEQQQRQQKEQLEQQRKAEQQRKEQEKRQAQAALAAVEAERQAKENAHTQQQRINVARSSLRRHLETQLLQLPSPKAPANDMTFIPNSAQPDFCYLLGLDLVVQRNMKDKAVFK